jgi:hypothetical protein
VKREPGFASQSIAWFHAEMWLGFLQQTRSGGLNDDAVLLEVAVEFTAQSPQSQIAAWRA